MLFPSFNNILIFFLFFSLFTLLFSLKYSATFQEKRIGGIQFCELDDILKPKRGCAMRMRLRNSLPDNGAVRVLVITEKQYESIDIMLGRLTEAGEPFQCEQLSFFEKKL